jgi:hypothetical protein
LKELRPESDGVYGTEKIVGEKQLRKVVGNGHWMAEIKFDGERMMLHKHKGALKLFSRCVLSVCIDVLGGIELLTRRVSEIVWITPIGMTMVLRSPRSRCIYYLMIAFWTVK